MNIPGFTAEASLRQGSDRHIAPKALEITPSEKVIVPQARILNCFCFRSGRYCCCRGADGTWACGATIST